MKRWLAALVALGMTLTGGAQTIRVEMHNIVELSERFNVVFIVEGEHAPSDFHWDPGDDFTLVWGPQKGTSTSVSFVNGKTSRSSQTSYTYILQARKTGSFQFPPATATVKGTEIRSKAPSITVVDNGSSSAQGSGSQGGNSQGSGQEASRPSASSDAGDLFLRLNLSRREAVVGEPITATLKIYQRANLSGFEDAKFPTFNGFWSQEVDAPQNIEFHREQLGDRMYNAAVLRRWVLIPQKAGNLTIDPSEIVCLVNIRTQRARTGSIFDDFFENDYVTQRQRVTTPAVTVKVSALPAGAPAGFSGAVGDYSVTARLSKDSLKTHDAASLIVTVSGKGNVSLVDAPKLSFPPDFEVYDVKATTSTDKGGTNGTKTFEYPFIPRSPGDFVLSPVRFSYYDVNAHRYATAATDSLRLCVARSATGSATRENGAGTLTVDRKGVKNLGEDIRFIKTKTDLKEDTGFFVGKPLYWVLAALLLAAAVAVWLSLRKLAARRADVALSRNRKATRQALKRLKLAGDFLGKNLYTAFYEELHRALIGFVADKLTMDMADQSKENIAAALAERGVPEGTVTAFTDLLDACEYARYAPDAGHEAMNAHYEQAVSVITSIDSSMKKGAPVSAAAPLIALLLALPLGAQAADSYPDSLWKAGVAAYTASDWNQAVSDWSDLADTGLRSKELYYNLGNACFKAGETARAILNYERALRLDPSDADVRYNLEYARSMTQDRIDEVPEFILKTWIRKVNYLLPSNAWAVLSLVLLALTLALALLFLLGPTVGSRRSGFFTGIAALLLTVMCWGFARSQKADAERHDTAIVMRPVTSVTSSPSSDSAKSLFILHEGTRVRILDEVSGYTDIELSDGRRGWLPSGDIEII